MELFYLNEEYEKIIINTNQEAETLVFYKK